MGLLARTCKMIERSKLDRQVRTLIYKFRTNLFNILVEKKDFDWERAAGTVVKFYTEMKSFFELLNDHYTVDVWLKQPEAFIDIAIEYYNLWIKYRINLIGELSPVEKSLGLDFYSVSRLWEEIQEC